MADEPTEQPPVEPAPEPAPEPTAAPAAGEPTARPWYEGRIDALTRNFRDAERTVADREQRIRELEAKLTPAPAPASAQPAPAGMVPHSEVEKIANERAAFLADKQVFDEQSNAVANAGRVKYGAAFDAALNTLKMAGGMGRHHIEALFETGQADSVVMELAKDPAEAARVLALPAIRGIAAIALVGAKLSGVGSAKPKALSKAPAPLDEPINGGGVKPELDLYDDGVDTAAWMAKRNAEIRARNKQ